MTGADTTRPSSPGRPPGPRIQGTGRVADPRDATRVIPVATARMVNVEHARRRGPAPGDAPRGGLRGWLAPPCADDPGRPPPRRRGPRAGRGVPLSQIIQIGPNGEAPAA